MKKISDEIIKDIVDELYHRNILSNLTRPLYVERMLARLLDGSLKCVGGDWSGWDLEHPETGLRVEVKQSAARQTWTDGPSRVGKPSAPIFDIRERTGYFVNDGEDWVARPGRPADIYIFAWHPGFTPLEEVDHTDPEQWRFYLLPETLLPTKQKTIGLNSLVRLGPVSARHEDIAKKFAALTAELTNLKAAADRALQVPSPTRLER